MFGVSTKTAETVVATEGFMLIERLVVSCQTSLIYQPTSSIPSFGFAVIVTISPIITFCEKLFEYVSPLNEIVPPLPTSIVSGTVYSEKYAIKFATSPFSVGTTLG